jgi:hypothetical protein
MIPMFDDSLVKSECSDILKSAIHLASVQVVYTWIPSSPMPSTIPLQHNYNITCD